jgi:hypothetical protein
MSSFIKFEVRTLDGAGEGQKSLTDKSDKIGKQVRKLYFIFGYRHKKTEKYIQKVTLLISCQRIYLVLLLQVRG